MNDFKTFLIDKIIGVEAGYVDDPTDLGGKTKFGITEETAHEYKYLWDQFDFTGNMGLLPIALARAIYSEGWWDRLKCNQIMDYSPNLVERLMDFGINTGRGNAGASLQRILNVMNKGGTLYANIVADGSVGPATLRALDGYFHSNYDDADEKIVLLMYSMQNYHYINISEQRASEANERFTRGWVNRTYHDWMEYAERLMKRKG